MKNDGNIPNFEAVLLAPEKHRFCLCIFVLNEGERIKNQLAKMTKYAESVDIIVVDGGSNDGALNKEYLQQCGVRALLKKNEPGQGLGIQIRMGFSYALLEGYEGVITMDGNDKDDPSSIPLFLKTLTEGFDHIQGSRFIPDGKHENTPFIRYLAIRYLHAPLVRWASKFPYTDTTNGFRAYSKKFLLDPLVAPLRKTFQGYEIFPYLAIRAPQLGYRVKEIPVIRRYPAQGPVPTKMKTFWSKMKLFLELTKVCASFYDPVIPWRFF